MSLVIQIKITLQIKKFLVGEVRWPSTRAPAAGRERPFWYFL
jgi:hypothetical protein